MKKLIYILLILPFTLYAQENKDIESEIDSLLNLACDGFRLYDWQKTFEVSQRAFNLSENLDYKTGIAKSNYYLATVYNDLGEYTKAMQCLADCLSEEYTFTNPQLAANALMARGYVFTKLNLYERSRKDYKEALIYAGQIEKENDRDYSKSLIYENLYYLYDRTQNIDSAKKYLETNEMVLAKLEERNYFTIKINHLLNQANFNLELGQTNEVKDYLDQAFELTDKYTYPYMSYLLEAKADYFAQKEDFSTAIEWYQKSLESLASKRLTDQKPEILNKIAKAYKSMRTAKLS